MRRQRGHEQIKSPDHIYRNDARYDIPEDLIEIVQSTLTGLDRGNQQQSYNGEEQRFGKSQTQSTDSEQGEVRGAEEGAP